ncbi:hypothetical protein GCM10025331_49850 [Actinoplanes utahensis]|nr:hypothetical protein Aut01nite_55820 [Actinoplanes utahensis]
MVTSSDAAPVGNGAVAPSEADGIATAVSSEEERADGIAAVASSWPAWAVIVAVVSSGVGCRSDGTPPGDGVADLSDMNTSAPAGGTRGCLSLELILPASEANTVRQYYRKTDLHRLPSPA